MNATTFYIVRHGESVGNANFDQGISSDFGELGSDLTEKGRKQVKDLAGVIKHIHFDAVYSSDLIRAKRTAEIIALERGLAVTSSRALRERSFGHNEKKYELIKEEIKERLKKLTSAERFTYKHTPDVESMHESARRLLTFMREIAIGLEGKTVLIVTHGNIIRSILIKLGFAGFDELPGRGTSVANAAYVILESDGTDIVVKETHGITKAGVNNEE